MLVEEAHGVGEADDLRDLAERLLTHRSPDGAHHAQLLLGSLPEGLSLPMPREGRLIGSLVRQPGWQTDRDVEIVVEAPGSEKQLLDFYEEALRPRGWRSEPDFAPHSGGFAGAHHPMGRLLRREGGDVALLVGANPVRDGRTEVRIHSQWMPRPDLEEFRPRPYGSDLLPTLRPPEGLHLQDQGGGGGGGSWTSSASTETEMTVSELEAIFAGQLAEAGWTRRTGAVAGPLAASTWTVPGTREHVGYLFVLEGPEPKRTNLWVRVETPGARGGGFATTSTSSLTFSI